MDDKIIDSLIMEAIGNPEPRVCKMCGCDFVGIKLICDSKECAAAWHIRCENLDRKYATYLTRPQPKAFLVFYGNQEDEKE